MGLETTLIKAVSMIDKELARLGNVLAVPFLYDLYIPYHKRFVDMRSNVIRELFVPYSTYPLVLLGTPIVRGIRTTTDADFSQDAVYVKTLKTRGKHRGRDLWGSFVTWANFKELPKDTGGLVKLLPFLWYTAIIRAKPLGVPYKGGKYFNKLVPNPVSLFTILDRDNNPIIISPFSAMMVLSVEEDSQRIPYLPYAFHARRATAYTFVTSGREVRFAGPFRAFVPEIEGINLDVEPGETVLDYYTGLAVFPAQGFRSVAIGPINSIHGGRKTIGYFLILGRVPICPRLYYALTFGSPLGGDEKRASMEDFKQWEGSLAKALLALGRKVKFGERWDAETFTKLYEDLIRREEEDGEIIVPEAHSLLKALAWGIDPMSDIGSSKLTEPLFEIPHPLILRKISTMVDGIVRNLLDAGLGILV